MVTIFSHRKYIQIHICLQTRKTAGWLAGKLSQDGHSVGVLSGIYHLINANIANHIDIINVSFRQVN